MIVAIVVAVAAAAGWPQLGSRVWETLAVMVVMPVVIKVEAMIFYLPTYFAGVAINIACRVDS